MSKHRDSVQARVPPDVAEQACRRAISELGWRLLEDEGRRLVAKEVSPQATSFTWSARVEVLVEEGTGGADISLNGSITGVGPVQKGHLKGQVGALKNKIGLALEETGAGPSATAGAGDLSGELARLAGLHESGALTDEEFAQAKARLLAGG